MKKLKKIREPQWHTKKIKIELELTVLNQFAPGQCVYCPFRDYSTDEFEIYLDHATKICEKSICLFGCTRGTCPITKYGEIIDNPTQKS